MNIVKIKIMIRNLEIQGQNLRAVTMTVIITFANDRDILRVVTVAVSVSTVTTELESGLSTSAVHIVQEDWSCSLSKKGCTFSCCIGPKQCTKTIYLPHDIFINNARKFKLEFQLKWINFEVLILFLYSSCFLTIPTEM